jgi:GT2 family glycosyltransferase
VTVYALMPVFNRLAMTRSMLADIRAQVLDEPIKVVVIDDGSSDGTAEFLLSQSDVLVVKGDGALWWGGAIDVGLRMVLKVAVPSDWVLFVNNDTHVRADFVQSLLTTARQLSPAAVGSIIRQDSSPFAIRSVGPKIDAWRLLVEDIFVPDRAMELDLETGVHTVDALSGRGVLFPLKSLQAVAGMRPKYLPHYLADYEVSLRVRAAGWRLVVDFDAAVYSKDEYGSSYRSAGLFQKFFSARSPSYLPAQLCFWWGASNFWQRLTLPPRLLLISLFPNIRKKK